MRLGFRRVTTLLPCAASPVKRRERIVARRIKLGK